MREIIFKGKRTDNGEWAEGFYTLYAQAVGVYPCILTGTEKGNVIPAFVDENTVGQYTGLTDKNGKKIWEGDIIKADNWLHQNMKIYTIVFENSGFYAKHKDEDCWNFDHLENIEIIGNIHDNPELLKGDAEK